jgi:hypothetical protein
MKLKKIKTINELAYLARTNKSYEQLAIVAASNLGGGKLTLNGAIDWLNTNAMETDESGVVDEINFCRNLVEA